MLKSAQVSSCVYVSIEFSVSYEPRERLFVRSIHDHVFVGSPKLLS